MTECVGSVGFKDSSVSLVTGTSDSPENGKLQLAISELVGARSSDLVLLVEDSSADNGNSVWGSTMISSHLSMKLTDGTIEGDISVLLVHVVVSGT